MWWLDPELRCGHVTIINRGITPKFADFGRTFALPLIFLSVCLLFCVFKVKCDDVLRQCEPVSELDKGEAGLCKISP
jgi:hypothetical protein